MNEKLVGQHGVLMLGYNQDLPKYLGKFINAEFASPNVLLNFSEHKLFLFTPLRIFSVGYEKNENGIYGSKGGEFSETLFIGDKWFGDIVNEWIKQFAEKKEEENGSSGECS